MNNISGLPVTGGLFGFEGATPPVGALRQETESGHSRSFGAAVVLESGRGGEEDASGLYGSDARMLKSLEARDQATREAAMTEGEAVGGRQFVYQTGPDGQQYAIGSLPHVVRREEDGAAPRGEIAGGQTDATGRAMDSDDQALLSKLQARDAKVRAHEHSHIMAAGGQAQGLPQYSYQTGPDGRQYAVGGSVNISITTSGDAQASARQAETARRAALATGEPSVRDSLTAAQAGDMAARARQRAVDSYTGAGRSDAASEISLTA